MKLGREVASLCQSGTGKEWLWAAAPVPLNEKRGVSGKVAGDGLHCGSALTTSTPRTSNTPTHTYSVTVNKVKKKPATSAQTTGETPLMIDLILGLGGRQMQTKY